MIKPTYLNRVNISLMITSIEGTPKVYTGLHLDPKNKPPQPRVLHPPEPLPDPKQSTTTSTTKHPKHSSPNKTVHVNVIVSVTPFCPFNPARKSHRDFAYPSLAYHSDPHLPNPNPTPQYKQCYSRPRATITPAPLLQPHRSLATAGGAPLGCFAWGIVGCMCGGGALLRDAMM
jgi:hypothetical protein